MKAMQAQHKAQALVASLVASLAAAVVAVLTFGSASSGWAATNHELVNQALNKTLAERAHADKQHEKLMDRPDEMSRGDTTQDERITVIMDGEIGGRTSRLHDHFSYSDARPTDVKHVEAHLDKEIKEIDASVSKADADTERIVRSVRDRERTRN